MIYIKNQLAQLILLLVLTAIIVGGCKKEEVMDYPDLGHQYFPLQKGLTIIYQVDSITWNDFFQPIRVDSFSFYVKMEIDSQFIDNEGRESFYWRKYYRNDTSNWQLIRNYTITRTSAKAESFEENNRYIKMIFPIKSSSVWDLNAMNSNNPTQSYYEDFDISMNVNNLNFDSVAVVIHYDSETLISKTFHREVYAKNMGLIQKNQISISKNTMGKWINGYQLEYKVISIENN